ncbi:MAG: hypothetical protein IKU96_06125 [Alistipes sp.]|nr:hypothetical protein [Alistipes sp.]
MNIKIDKLKICYTLTEQSILHDLMVNPTDEFEHPEWGFSLRRVEGKHFNHIYEIIYLDYTDNSMREFDHQCFGTLRWGLRSDKEGEMDKFVWIAIDNRQFYLNYDYNTKSRMVYLEYIEAMLGLCFHNLTQLDLAMDDGKNLSKRLIRAIRDDSLVPIVNGKKVEKRDELLEDILYIGTGDCRRIREYSLLIKQKNGDVRLMAYNKKREVENASHKDYILDANGNPNHLHRLEVRVSSDALREYIERERIIYDPMMFTDEAWLWRTFLDFAGRVLRFQSAEGRKCYDVLDLVA